MNCFPVSSSILAANALADLVKQQYALPADTSCVLLKAGVNHTYRISSSAGQYVLRVYSYDWRTVEEIQEELDLLEWLQKHNIAVSYPIFNKDHQYILTIPAPEGERLAVLFSFAPGHKVQHYDSSWHYRTGELMARIHLLTASRKQQQRATYTPEVLLDDSLRYIGQYLPADADEMQFMFAAKDKLKIFLDRAATDTLRKGIVHMDIWFDNMNITEDGDITLFDFDFCGNGWLCLDIAYYIMQLHNTEREEIVRKEKMHAFLNGYESVHPISSEEKAMLPALGVCIYFFYLGTQCRRFENWSNTFLNEVYLKRYIQVFIKGYYNIAFLPTQSLSSWV